LYSSRHAELIETLKTCGVRNRRVIEALEEVPRHLFVPEEARGRSYDNVPLPIGDGQTISQPLMVALALEALELEGGEKVLEVGTGSGYQAALLSRLAREVHTVERLEGLHASARVRLEDLGYRNVRCHLGDGTAGLPAEAPFDAILVAAAGPSIPAPLVEELAPGGRLVIPIGSREGQALRRVRRAGGAGGAAGDSVESLMDVRFVPLLGRHGWPEADGPRSARP
jgi:protein-L-isoaspartate(D-aspartate) O-methyltransferase